MGETHDKIFWHDAFYEAVQLELADYKDVLAFENEHQLSKEALKMDVLIIKKEKDVEIKKNIGRIFREHNICEYKSETDYLSVYDYNKVVGYAFLYSAFEHVDIDNITITFAVTKHPRDLIKYLGSERGLEITEVFSGVYYLAGDLIPIQILESKRLSEDDNLFLKSLRSNLNTEDLVKLLRAYQKQGKYDKNNAYIDRIMEANQDVLKEVSSMSMVEVDDLFKKVEGWATEIENKGIEKIKKEIARDMLSDGEPIERIVKLTKLPIAMIKELQIQITAQ